MREYMFFIWSFVDPIYFRCSRLSYLPKTNSVRNIFRVRLTRYKGRNITLSDGTEITKNDFLIKVHLHNLHLLKELKGVSNELKRAKIIYRYVQHSLPGIEQYIRNHSKSNQLKGIIGITGLNKGCERLGFEVFKITNPFYRRLKWLSSFPISVLSRKINIKKHIKNFQPSYLLMSKEKLSTMYRIK